MPVSGLAFTQAGDGMPKGTKAPKAKPKKRSKKPTDSATPALMSRDTPASNAATDYDSSSKIDAGGDKDGTPFFPVSEDLARPVPKTPVLAPKKATDPISVGRDDDAISTIEPNLASEDENNIFLDLRSTDRELYREPTTGIQRPFWAPGDGDGGEHDDRQDRPGAPPPLEKRWRFFQLTPVDGPVSLKNIPKYVILDDRATSECLRSSIPRANLTRFWPHDFGGPGKIRARRPHRGRAAIANPDAEGNAKFHFGPVGSKDEKYYFTGEKDYRPRIFRAPQPDPPPPEPAVTPAESESRKRKAESEASSERSSKKHGHNQYTPKEELVKYGAPSSAEGRKRYKPRINTWNREEDDPQWAKDNSKYYGGVGDQAKAAQFGRGFGDVSAASLALQAALGGDMGPLPSGIPARASPLSKVPSVVVAGPESVEEAEEKEESMWVEQDNENSAGDLAPFANTGAADDDDGSDAEFPFARKPGPRTMTDTTAAADGGPVGTQHRKEPKQLGYLERMAAEQEAALNVSPTQSTPKGNDSGSYATKLERQLADANNTIDELNTALANAQMRIEELEGEISSLQGASHDGE